LKKITVNEVPNHVFVVFTSDYLNQFNDDDLMRQRNKYLDDKIKIHGSSFAHCDLDLLSKYNLR